MKLKTLILLAIFCILLTAYCRASTKSPTANKSPEPSSGKSTITITSSDNYVYPAIDYSDHTNQAEETFITKLADPSKIKEG